MFGCLRHWAIAGAIVTSHCAMAGVGVSGLATRSMANVGYLPAVGPVELRFRDPIQPITNMAQMPLPQPFVEKTNEPPPVEMVEKAPAPVQTPAVPPPDTNPPVPPPVPVSAPNPSDPMISPQMLLKYFNRNTNGASTGMIAPMEFAPPTQAAPPSSTATYTISPAPH